MNIYDQIKTMTDEMAGDLVAQRRDFHKYAEPGWFEMRTSSKKSIYIFFHGVPQSQQSVIAL